MATKIHPTASTENNIKIGRFNLPTTTFLVLLLSTASFLLLDVPGSYNATLFYLHTVTCFIASILGVMTLVFLLIKSKKINNKIHYWTAFLLSIIAFASPIWFLALHLKNMVSIVK